MVKNVQIPETLFMDLYFFFENYNRSESVQGEEQKRLLRIRHGISKKATALVARQTYGEYKRCHNDEKDAKLKDHLNTKEFYKLREARHGNV